MGKLGLGIIGVIVAIGFMLVGLYNGLVTKNLAVTTQWAQVETQYQRRFDLIPNLVASTQGVLTQEQKVFGDIAEARTRYSGATTPDARAAAAGQVESALGRLLVVMENYPQLRSSETVANLMTELTGTENRVAVERKRYNDTVSEFNLAIKTFPTNLIAGMLGFSERNFFNAAEAADTPPKVELNQNP